MLKQSHLHLPINAAARNAMWTYPRVILPRFAGAPEVVETHRSCEAPDWNALPEGAEVEVEFYGGAITFRLEGWLNRISIKRFEWVKFADEQGAREAFIELWVSVKNERSAVEVTSAAAKWRALWQSHTKE